MLGVPLSRRWRFGEEDTVRILSMGLIFRLQRILCLQRPPRLQRILRLQQPPRLELWGDRAVEIA